MLEGLEATEIKLSRVVNEDSVFRWDSEFYRKMILQAKTAVEKCPHQFLDKLSSRIQHPAEVVRMYTDDGIRILLAQEVRNNTLSLGEGSFMDFAIEEKLRENRLNVGDVVLTRSGANFGQCAPILSNEILYACADLLVIRKETFPGEYISTFLNTKYEVS